jgi:hypothetical protein
MPVTVNNPGYLAADRARWRKVIQDAQIQPE